MTRSWRRTLEQYFEFTKLETNWRTEALAGVTTFVTMAYIIFVNPAMLHEAGMPLGAVTVATCLSAALASFAMGVFARYPIALAPGMGLNAYFTYAVVKGMGIPWQTALGAVFLSGVAFLVLTAAGIRRAIVTSVPKELYAAVACGVGLFIALIGLRNAGIVAADRATLVTLGNLRAPGTALALLGLLLTAALLAWRVRAAILLGILATSTVALTTGLAHWQPQSWGLLDIRETVFQLDIRKAAGLGVAEVVFAFLFVDLFDNLGTLVAVSQKAGLVERGQRLPRLDRILFTDACATIFGSLTGTSTVVSYIESSAGVAAGGRTGVTAIVVAMLFLLVIPVAPLVGAIPGAATAPALIIVGSLMMSASLEIEWSEPAAAIPAFLTIVGIPLTFSIANGLTLGFCSWTLLRVARGQWRTVNWFVYLLTALFLVRFYYLGTGV